MTNQEAVNWIINISADIGKMQHQELWHYEQALAEIKELLETPQRQKTGHWEITEVRQYDLAYGGRIYVPEYRCSCCGHWYESYVRGDEPQMPDDADFPKYCEQCGCRMVGEEE